MPDVVFSGDVAQGRRQPPADDRSLHVRDALRDVVLGDVFPGDVAQGGRGEGRGRVFRPLLNLYLIKDEPLLLIA